MSEQLHCLVRIGRGPRRSRLVDRDTLKAWIAEGTIKETGARAQVMGYKYVVKSGMKEVFLPERP